MPSNHKTVSLMTHYGPADIDAEIAALIATMNTIEGLETMNCCQSGNEHFEMGYVQFGDDGSKHFKGVCVCFQQIMLKLMDSEWQKHGRMMSRHYSEHGCHPKEADFYFVAVLGDGYIMRWSPYTYPAILTSARKAAKQMKTARKCDT